MDERLSLSIRLVKQSPDFLRLRLAIKNRSAAKLLLPFQEIIGLRFRATTTLKEAEWFTHTLLSTSFEGIPLEAGATRRFNFDVWPCDAAERCFGDDAERRPRWCVALPPGSYSVSFTLRVNEDYFDPDSHWRLDDLKRYATSLGAIAWQGEAVSNELQVNRS